MILGVSVGRGFDDYGFLHKQLSALECTEIVSIAHALVKRFCKETNKPYQEIPVYWDDIRGCDNIKTNKFGKKYNGDAMKDAMKRFDDYVEKIIEFGGGAYALPKGAKEKLIVGADFKGVAGAPPAKKTYKF
jgi:hypothetical protein